MRLLCERPAACMEFKSAAGIKPSSACSGSQGDSVVISRMNPVNAFYFVAYRSFVAALVLRVVLITTVFALAFATHASAQQKPDEPKPKSDYGLMGLFLNNFVNGSQDIPDSPWPYNSGPPSDLRKFPVLQNSPPFPYGEYRSAARRSSATERADRLSADEGPA